MLKIIILSAYFVSLFFIIFWILVFLEKGVKDKKIKLNVFPKVSICIPAYNEEDSIEETINSALKLDYPEKNIEILIVNDGSTDKTREIAEKVIKNNKHRNIILINQINKGKAVAMNTGLKVATGEYFISLDADSVPKKDILKKILPYFTEENIAAVLPLIRIEKPRTFMQRIQHCEYSINFFYKKLMSNLDCVHVTPGPFSVYKTSILRKIKGYDPGNITEDLEIAVRLQRNYYRIIQLLIPEIETKAPPTFCEFYKQRNRWYKGSLINLWRNRDMIFNKNYGDFGMFQLPMILMSAILSVTLFVSFVIIMFLRPLVKTLINFSFINFDVSPAVRKAVSYFTLFDVNISPLFYGIILSLFGLFFLLLSFSNTRMSVKKNIKAIVPYILVYPFIISIIWIGVLFDLIRGNTKKW